MIWLSYAAVFLTFIAAVGIAYSVYQRKQWIKREVTPWRNGEMRPGEYCYVNSGEHERFYGTIQEIDDDTVKVIVTLDKNRLYPYAKKTKS